MRDLTLALIICISPLLLQACFYVPTAEHGLMAGRAMIRDNDIESLEPGVTTRTDVLLAFGSPSERLDDDRIYCYDWVRVQGLIGAMYAYAEVGQHHLFCTQFCPMTACRSRINNRPV